MIDSLRNKFLIFSVLICVRGSFNFHTPKHGRSKSVFDGDNSIQATPGRGQEILLRTNQFAVPPIVRVANKDQTIGGHNRFVKVWFDEERIPERSHAQLAEVAKTLETNLLAPADRWKFYSAVDNRNQCKIDGWVAIISSMKGYADRSLIKLQVYPHVDSTWGATTILIPLEYYEYYGVKPDGKIDFVRSSYPLSDVGQLPVLIGL